MTPRYRVILDTDIGTDVDDLMALALILGTPTIELLGVTTVYGDTLLRAQMVKRIARLAARDVPVHAGRPATMSGRDVWWAGHEGGLHEDLDAEQLDGTDAVGYLVESVCESPGHVDVIAIGPLTNIAAAIERDSRFASALRHLWIMGGAFTSDEPEHNFRSDTTAARIVFEAGIPTTITGLEATRRISIGSDALARIGAAGTLGSMIDAEIRQWWAFWNEEWNVPHDPVTVLSLTRPDLFELSPRGRVVIEEAGDLAGRSRFVAGTGTARIVLDLDVDEVVEEIVGGIIAAGMA